jgi:hypothetical protein
LTFKPLSAGAVMGVANSETFAFQERRPERWIDVKREIYLDHEACEALLIVQQGRIEAQFDIRRPNGWKSATITGPTAELNLPPIGPKCLLGQLYEGTPHQPRVIRQHRP